MYAQQTYHPPTVGTSEMYFGPKVRDQSRDSRKSTTYLILGIVFTVLGFVFLWTYVFGWLFFVLAAIFYGLASTSKYRMSAFKTPRRNAIIAQVCQAVLCLMFCFLFVITIAVLLGGLLGGLDNRNYNINTNNQ